MATLKKAQSLNVLFKPLPVVTQILNDYELLCVRKPFYWTITDNVA